jgi:hypothetical protein
LCVSVESEERILAPKSELCYGRCPLIAYSGADQQLDGEAPAADEPVLQRQQNSGVSVRGTPRPQSAACTSGEQLRPARTPVLLLQVCKRRMVTSNGWLRISRTGRGTNNLVGKIIFHG